MTEGADIVDPFESAQQRVALFVDTQNLFFAARDLRGGVVDYGRLLDVAARGRRMSHATAYVVEREGDGSTYGFVAKLTALGFRVRRLKVRVRVSEDDRPVLEGDWDLGIAVDVFRTLGSVDVVALATGDGDFTPVARLAQERGARVEILAFRDFASQELQDACDRFIDLADVDGIFLPPRQA